MNGGSYNYGYELGPNRQFHHEISSDGVTVGCFGYVNTEEKLLVTHYVADDHGYRVVQSNKPTRIYPKSSGLKILTPDESENFVIKQGKFTDWKDLKMPNECRSSDLEVISDNFKQQAGLKGLPNLPEPGVDVNSIKNLPSNDKTTNTESASNSLSSSPDNVDFRNPKYNQEGSDTSVDGRYGNGEGQGSLPIDLQRSDPQFGNPNQGSNHNYGGSHQHGGSFTHTGHHGTTSGQINSQHQGSSHENGGSYQHGGSFVHTGHHGQTSGSHQSGGSWGQQGQYKPDNSGQYVPDNSGSYVHQPGENGPDSPPYEHVQGPSGGSGGQGNGGGYGPSGGYGPDGGQGPNGPDGPDGPNGPNGPSGGYGPSGGNGGNGDNSENSHQNNNCNNPDHQHSTTSRPTFTRPTTRKTTVFSPRPSSSRPTTQTQYPQTSPSNYPSYVPPSSTEYTTERPKQTYPTRPMSTPNPTGSGSGNLGVQPPSTRPTTPNPNLYVPGNQPPFFIIPFPFPFAPTCPCYFAEPKGNYSSQNQQQMQWQQHMEQNNQWQSQVQYAIGFIPVLFVPHCSPSNHSNQLSGQYLQVPYPCAQCNQSQRNSRGLDSTENYSSSDSFRQVLAQAGVDIFSNSLVKSPNRNSRARKLKRFRNVEESNFNELTDNKQNSSKDEK
ncbi:CLUMA_CG007169, isoform A [Clunio marinus]|uniref:CLUMA_CG007169, isoform A n=1 Tax=Clunio marinus TaxID=568069 RepID=A0A1J1HZW1_9DIPT|nr:CLUMA_CG007169, isoform A [Clunio marinus]